MDGRPLYEVIVREAREMGLGRRDRPRGIEGFGANNRVHTVKVLRLSRKTCQSLLRFSTRSDSIIGVPGRNSTPLLPKVSSTWKKYGPLATGATGGEPEVEDDIPLEEPAGYLP